VDDLLEEYLADAAFLDVCNKTATLGTATKERSCIMRI
jgi:hypothetical protein